MNERSRDPVGTGVAALLGVFFGIALAAPMLPRTLPGAEITVTPVGAALLAGSLAVVAVPLGVVLLYLVSAQLDR